MIEEIQVFARHRVYLSLQRGDTSRGERGEGRGGDLCGNDTDKVPDSRIRHKVRGNSVYYERRERRHRFAQSSVS